jgi:hypothetical protein
LVGNEASSRFLFVDLLFLEWRNFTKDSRNEDQYLREKRKLFESELPTPCHDIVLIKADVNQTLEILLKQSSIDYPMWL